MLHFEVMVVASHIHGTTRLRASERAAPLRPGLTRASSQGVARGCDHPFWVGHGVRRYRPEPTGAQGSGLSASGQSTPAQGTPLRSPATRSRSSTALESAGRAFTTTLSEPPAGSRCLGPERRRQLEPGPAAPTSKEETEDPQGQGDKYRDPEQGNHGPDVEEDQPHDEQNDRRREQEMYQCVLLELS